MDEVYSSRPDLMDFPSQIWSSNFSQMEAVSSRMDDERPDSQSPLLTTLYRLKPYRKAGLHNKQNFGHWFRNYDLQRENG
jgi:hypothetical protein